MTNSLIFLGISYLGYLVVFLTSDIPFYIKNKRWPPHPAELIQQQEQIIHTSKMQMKDLQIQLLQDRIEELEQDLGNLWKKTLNRIQSE